MKLHLRIHKHFKQHHKKYLLGTGLAGAGFLAVKVLLLTIGSLSLLTHGGAFADGPVCGDSVVESPEMCDDGAYNGMPGFCNETCEYVLPPDDGGGYGGFPGCTDPAADNYDEYADMEDGSCEYAGCTDETASNYNPDATIEDDSCEYDVPGCTNEAANNYDPEATVDDESCLFDTAEDDLIAAYYGPDSVYTTHRTGNACDTGAMTVEYINNYATSGADAIPQILSGNTLYVLLSGSHITSRYIHLANCSAMIGSGNVTIYSSGDRLPGMLSAEDKENTIIDNISVDGRNNGVGGQNEQKNYNGILLQNNSNNNTVNNVHVYNNYYRGIFVENSVNNIISNSQFYDNDGGVDFCHAVNNIVDNVQTYNNVTWGIFLWNSSLNNTINNVQAYNNGSHGIELIDSDYNIINNTQAYSNTNDGIYLFGSIDNTLNNIQLYNNNLGIHFNGASGNALNNVYSYGNAYGISFDGFDNADNKYYGILKISDNTTAGYIDQRDLYPGGDTAFFSGGLIDTGDTMSCAWITNPMNANGSFLINESTYTNCKSPGRKTSRTGNADISYLYGTGILKQTQALQDSGTETPLYSWSDISFSTNKYIAEIHPMINGFLTLASGQTYTLTTGIQVQLLAVGGANYVLTGDFVGSPIEGTLTGTKNLDVTLTEGFGTKSITVLYSTGDEEKNISKSINYVDGNGLPFVYFTSGSTYTTNRVSNACDPGEMTVEYITPGTNQLPENLSGNTIYVLSSGSYIFSYSTDSETRLNNCSAVIGSGDVTLYSASYAYRLLLVEGKSNIIIDNIHIDGTSDGNGSSHSRNFAGVQLSNANNVTVINNSVYNTNFSIKVDASNNNMFSNNELYDSAYGVHMNGSYNNSISGAQIYNTSGGIYLWLVTGSTINNAQVHNNTSYGIYLYYSTNNIIDNSQIYNNSSHSLLVEEGSHNNTINNTQVYNNYHGIWLQSADNTTISNSHTYNNANNGIALQYSHNAAIVNSDIYNNNKGIYRYSSPDTTYYGTVKLFANTENADELVAGTASEFFSGGVLDTGDTMSCARVTNPMDTNGIFLMDETAYPNCNIRGFRSSRIEALTGYLYGVNMSNQTQAISDAGTSHNAIYSWSPLTWDGNNYIAEFNKVINGSLVLASGQTYTLDTGIQVQLTVTEPVNYVIAGDFEESPITGTLADTETQNITLTTGYETKQISVTYSTGDRERVFNKTIRYPDPNGLPFTYFGSGSTYTQNRAENDCNPSEITVVYVNPGTNQTPHYLPSNTIYVLNSGSYLISGDYIYPSHCSALIGSGDVTIYSNGMFSRILLFNEATNNIIEHINIDGMGYANGDTHSRNPNGIQLIASSNNTISGSTLFNNQNGIKLEGSANNNTMDNNTVYDNSNAGFYISDSSNTSISGAQLYNSTYGIFLATASGTSITNVQNHDNVYGVYGYGSSNHITINNAQVHDTQYGIYIETSSDIEIRDSQVYTNAHGIWLHDNSNDNTIDNVQVYNNNDGILLENVTNTTVNNANVYNNIYNGIYLGNASGNTIDNSQSHNNGVYGIYLSSSSNNRISGSQAYNNIGNGIRLSVSSNNTISNSQSYNNSDVGIYLYSAVNNIINNSQIYNNGSHGISFEEFSDNTTINNSQVYNNSNGVHLYMAYNTTINNTALYNNTSEGIFMYYSPYTTINNCQVYNNSIGVYTYPSYPFPVSYHGTLKLFDNYSYNSYPESDRLAAGSDTEFFSGGVLDTGGTMSCDWVTNPMDTDGVFLLDNTEYPNCDLRGKNSARTGAADISYLYGMNMKKQAQALGDAGIIDHPAFSWLDGSWDASKYIAEINKLLNGSLVLASGQTYTLETGIQVQLTTTEPANYVLSGDFEESPITGTFTDTATENITLTTGYGIKHIMITYSTGERTRTITKNLGYPDPDGVPFAYFGSGSEYTKNRATNDCNPTAMTTEYIDPGTDTIPENLSTNTIYILLPGSYIITTDGGGINIATCSALIGSGDVTIYSQSILDRMLLIYDNTNAIIDNLSLNGLYNGNGQQHSPTYYGILVANASNNTINAVETYSNASHGIYLANMATYNTITNSQSYANQQYGIDIYDNADHNIINNTQIYNNGREGIIINSSVYNTINNCQVYNNSQNGIRLYDASNNTINHSQIYNNNGHGIALNSEANNNTISNSQSYSNESNGIYIEGDATNNRYYGTIKLFNNQGNINEISNITAGSDTEFFSGGILDEEGTMSCSWITNPMNSDGAFLMDEESYPTCDRQGTQSRVAGSNTKYFYGTNILKQTQPINQITIEEDDTFTWTGSTLSFDPTKYIAEVNPTLNGSLTIGSGQGYVVESGIQVQLTTTEPATYVLSGDFVGSPITGIIYDTIDGTVSLTTGYGVKQISVIYTTGSKERSIAKTIGYISSVNNYCEMITDLPRGECDALIAIYNSTNGSGRYEKDGWFGIGDTTPTTACDWYGVDCNDNEEGEGAYVYDLDFEENNLSGSIPAEVSNFTNLEYFYVSYNQITSIETGAFSGLANLSEVDISDNQLSNIASNSFYALSSLEYLYLGNNQIATIETEAFVDLPALYRLNIFDNEIATIESNAFSGLSNLEYLYLNNNHITTIKTGVFVALPALYRLDISYNEIATIESNAFSGLSNLEYLYLNDNLITTIGQGTFDGLANLDYLYMPYNRITTIESGAFSGLSTLQYLYLNNNLLTTILSSSFDGLSNVYELSLSYNEIADIESGAFSDLSNLEYLYLNNNLMTSILPGTFDGLANLYNLNFSYNDISTIRSDSFTGLPELKLLYLNYNQLTGSLDIFCSLTGVYQLYVDHNRFAGDIPACLTGISMNRGGSIAYNYLDTDVEDPSDLLNYLDNYLWDWRMQYALADIYLSGNVTSFGENSFVLHLGYHNAGPRALDDTTIYYDMIDGLDITSDTEFTTGATDTTYPGLADPCFAEWYNSGSGPYKDFFDAYARDYDEYDSLTDMMCNNREGFYCGNNSGAGKFIIDYIIDDDGPITDWREAFMDFFDDEDADIAYVPNCGIPGKNIYIFDLGTLEANSSGNILITGTFSDIINDGERTNNLEIFSPYELRADSITGNNYFSFAVPVIGDVIFVEDTGSIAVNNVDGKIGVIGAVAISGATTTGAIFTSTGVLEIFDATGTDNPAIIKFNTSGLIILASGWDGILPSAIEVTIGSPGYAEFGDQGIPDQSTNSGTATTTRTILTTRTAPANVPLILTGNFSEIYIPITGGSFGEHLAIYRSEDNGETWTGNTPDSECVVDANLMCHFRTDHFSLFAPIKTVTVNTTPDDNNHPTGGNGGGGYDSIDACPIQRDCSDSYYDKLCGKCSIIGNKKPVPTNKLTGAIAGSKFSTELNNAYLRAYSYDITTMPTIQKANMDGKLLRKDMAKMISNFAINILDRDVSTGARCEFDDMMNLPKETQYYAIAACRLGLMGWESDGKRTKHTFDPEAEVDRAQFGTILSRLIRQDKNNGGDVYYQKHLDALKREGIMTNIDKPLNKELRGRVMVMMKRIFDKE